MISPLMHTYKRGLRKGAAGNGGRSDDYGPVSVAAAAVQRRLGAVQT